MTTKNTKNTKNRENGILINRYHLQNPNTSKSSLPSKLDLEKTLKMALNTFQSHKLDTGNNSNNNNNIDKNINIAIDNPSVTNPDSNHCGTEKPSLVHQRERIRSATASVEHSRNNSNDDEHDAVIATTTATTSTTVDNFKSDNVKRLSLVRYLNHSIESYNLFKNFLTRSLAIENLLFLTEVQLFRNKVSKIMLEIGNKEDVETVAQMSGPYVKTPYVETTYVSTLSAQSGSQASRTRSATHERIIKLEFTYLEKYNNKTRKWTNSLSRKGSTSRKSIKNKQLCREWCRIHEKYVALGSLYQVKF